MAVSKYLLEDGTGSYLLEDNSGYYLMESGVTVTPNTADANSFTTATPALEFTGTQDDADDIRYNVQIDTVNTFDSQGSPGGVVDSYSESNQSATYRMDGAGGGTAQTIIGQSFTGNGTQLDYVRFQMSKSGAPTGNAVASIYAHTGTYGTTSLYTGTALATSDTFNVTALTTTPTLTTLTFSGDNKITLLNGVNYVLRLDFSGGAVFDYILIGTDNTTSTHSGNSMSNDTGTITVRAATDICFYVYSLGTSAPLSNKISGTDAGFLNTANGADTDPFTTGQKISYTPQSNLANGTYYWRVRGIDPNGSNTYSSWSTTNSFTVTAAAGSSSGQMKVYNGSAFVAKPVKVWNGSAWVTKPLKRWNGSAWITTPY